jgi:hypothetical protein
MAGVREAGRSESNSRAFETAHHQCRDDFCRQFVVTHIFETFHVSRRKNGKNAAKTEDVGLNTYTEIMTPGDPEY